MRLKNSRNKHLKIATAALMLAAAPALAEEAGNYGSLLFGAAIPRDTDLTVRPAPGMVLNGTLEFDSHAIGGLAVGRSFGNGFSVEGEMSFGRRPLDREILPGVFTMQMDGAIKSASLMLNGYYSFAPQGSFIPYLGAGIGATRFDLTGRPQGTAQWYRDKTTDFTYQIIAGVRHRISERTSLGLEYRFVSTNGISFSDDQGGGGNVHTRLDQDSHVVLLRMNVDF